MNSVITMETCIQVNHVLGWSVVLTVVVVALAVTVADSVVVVVVVVVYRLLCLSTNSFGSTELESQSDTPDDTATGNLTQLSPSLSCNSSPIPQIPANLARLDKGSARQSGDLSGPLRDSHHGQSRRLL